MEWRNDTVHPMTRFRCSSPPINIVYGRRVSPSTLAFSLSSHRHFVFVFCLALTLLLHNKQDFCSWTRPSKNFVVGFFVFSQWDLENDVLEDGPVGLVKVSIPKKISKLGWWSDTVQIYGLSSIFPDRPSVTDTV